MSALDELKHKINLTALEFSVVFMEVKRPDDAIKAADQLAALRQERDEAFEHLKNVLIAHDKDTQTFGDAITYSQAARWILDHAEKGT